MTQGSASASGHISRDPKVALKIYAYVRARLLARQTFVTHGETAGAVVKILSCFSKNAHFSKHRAR